MAQRGAELPLFENRPSIGAWRGPDLREALRYRELALILALRELQVRYKQTAFGIVWAILQPLLAAAIFTLVFSRLAKVPSDGIPYPAFALAGSIAWTYFSSAVTTASRSLVTNEALVTKIYFPRIVAPVSGILAPLVDLAVALPVLAIVMLASGVAPGPQIVLFPLVVVALAVLATAFGTLLAAAYVRYRDVGQALPLLIQLWLFATPVAYPSSLVEGQGAFLYALNPLAGAIDAVRWTLLDGPPPGAQDLLGVLVGALVLAWGLVYFGRTERRFADVI